MEMYKLEEMMAERDELRGGTVGEGGWRGGRMAGREDDLQGG